MTRASVHLAEWMQTQICPCCGHDDPRMRSDSDRPIFQCPDCGQDLYARPPVSYAVMEGFESMSCDADRGFVSDSFDTISATLERVSIKRKAAVFVPWNWLRNRLGRIWSRLTTRRYV